MKTLKFVADAGEMADAIGRASKATSSRKTVEILGGFRIDPNGDGLHITATDMSLSLREYVPATKVSGDGMVILNAAKVLAGLKTMKGQVAFEAKLAAKERNGILSVTEGKTTLRYSTVEEDDFPKIEFVQSKNPVSVPRDALVEAFKAVHPSISKDDSRPVLACAYIEADGSTLRITGTDSYRLTGVTVVLDKPPKDFLPVLVNGGDLDKVMKLLAKDAYDHLIIDQEVISEKGRDPYVKSLLIRGCTMTSRMRHVDGTYPNWRQFIPEVTPVKVTFDRNEMLSIVKRMTTLGNGFNPCKLSKDGDEVLLELDDNDLRQAAITSRIEGEWSLDERDGDSFAIGVNPKFFKDAMDTLDFDTVTAHMISPLRPVVFTNGGSDIDFLSRSRYVLLMPTRLRS